MAEVLEYHLLRETTEHTKSHVYSFFPAISAKLFATTAHELLEEVVLVRGLGASARRDLTLPSRVFYGRSPKTGGDIKKDTRYI